MSVIKCPSGKRRRSQMAAIAAAIRLSRRGKPLRVYHCKNLCGGWHLTSKELRV